MKARDIKFEPKSIRIINNNKPAINADAKAKLERPSERSEVPYWANEKPANTGYKPKYNNNNNGYSKPKPNPGFKKPFLGKPAGEKKPFVKKKPVPTSMLERAYAYTNTCKIVYKIFLMHNNGVATRVEDVYAKLKFKMENGKKLWYLDIPNSVSNFLDIYKVVKDNYITDISIFPDTNVRFIYSKELSVTAESLTPIKRLAINSLLDPKINFSK